VGNKPSIREIERPKCLLEDENGPISLHFDPIYRRWYILTCKLTLAVITEAGVLLREVNAPCVNNQQHHFEMILHHSARDRLLRTHCVQCMVLWDIGSSPNKEIPHLFSHHVLKANMGEQCPFKVVSSCDDVATRKVVVYKKVDDTLCSSVVMDMDHPEAERQETKFNIPLYSEILVKTYGDRFALYGGRERSAIRIVQLNGATKEQTDLCTVEGSIATSVVDTNLIAYQHANNNGKHLHYVDISTREVNVIPGPVLPNNTYAYCQTLTAEGDLHLMLVPGMEKFEFRLMVMSMRRGKQIRNWTFKVPDPNPAKTEQASRKRGCNSVPLLRCHGMMVCGSEVLINLGLHHDNYRSRIFSFQSL